MSGKDDQYSPEEAARRRDEVIRRMANTPPQQHVKHLPQSRKKTGAGRLAPKGKPGGRQRKS
jgi:hypothetical protein